MLFYCDLVFTCLHHLSFSNTGSMQAQVRQKLFIFLCSRMFNLYLNCNNWLRAVKSCIYRCRDHVFQWNKSTPVTSTNYFNWTSCYYHLLLRWHLLLSHISAHSFHVVTLMCALYDLSVTFLWSKWLQQGKQFPWLNWLQCGDDCLPFPLWQLVLLRVLVASWF